MTEVPEPGDYVRYSVDGVESGGVVVEVTYKHVPGKGEVVEIEFDKSGVVKFPREAFDD